MLVRSIDLFEQRTCVRACTGHASWLQRGYQNGEAGSAPQAPACIAANHRQKEHGVRDMGLIHTADQSGQPEGRQERVEACTLAALQARRSWWTLALTVVLPQLTFRLRLGLRRRSGGVWSVGVQSPLLCASRLSSCAPRACRAARRSLYHPSWAPVRAVS